MTESDLRGKRVLLLGVETELGRAVASALAEAGADIALVAATNDAEAAFGVQRLSRRLAPGGGRYPAQAIDATNEMAVRVMVRQVAKQMGGLDAFIFCADLGPLTRTALDFAVVYGAREMARHGGGAFVEVGATTKREPVELLKGVRCWFVIVKGRGELEVIGEVLGAIAGESRSG